MTDQTDTPDPVETVIRTISRYAFDTARAYIHTQIRLQKSSRTDFEILVCIRTELEVLSRVIAENVDTEVVFLPEMTDHKYNHYEAIEYILGRHYITDPPPDYFKKVCAYINQSKGIRCSEKVSWVLKEVLPKVSCPKLGR